jgi:pimeloyl-ACP methyl ester carboxylesterase
MGRGSEFDPSVDSVVRVEVGRLRARLREYYATDGRDAEIDIRLPKGRYAAAIGQGSRKPDDSPETPQDIRFLRTGDGVSIAYSVSGSGPPLVKAANWLSHIEYDYQSPIWRHWWQDLSKSNMLVRYDERGCGLSDWDVDDFSLEAWVSDLEAVIEKVGLERFPLLGISQGAAVAILYALRHPKRVSHLILYGGFAQGRLTRAVAQGDREEAKMLEGLARVGWGQKDSVFRKVFASLFVPDGAPEELAAFDALQRFSTSAQNAEKFIRAFNVIDVSAKLADVQVPTLVLHARDEIEIPVSQAYLLARNIPNARLVLLDSNRHILGANEPAWHEFTKAVANFTAG